jgi:hypothetical protein
MPTESANTAARYTFRPVNEDQLVDWPQYQQAPLEQTALWGRFQDVTPGRRHLGLYAVHQGEEAIGLVDLVEVIQRYYSYVWAKNGPFIFSPIDGFGEMITQLAELAKSLSPASQFLRIHSGQKPTVASPAFGFHITKTVIAKPLASYDEFIPTMPSPQGRNEARRSVKDPEITVVLASGAEYQKTRRYIDEFYDLWSQTAKEKNFGIHKRAYVHAMLRELGEACLLINAYYDSQIQAGAIVTYWGDTATYYYGATGHGKTTTYAGMRCVLEALNEAYRRGCGRLDFLGIEDGSSGRLSGVTRFKKKFTEQIEDLPPVWDVPLKSFRCRLLRFLYKIGRSGI